MALCRAALRGVRRPFQIVRVQAGHHPLRRTLRPHPGALTVAGNHGERQVTRQHLSGMPLARFCVIEASVNVWSCLELGDSVAMSPADRMRSLSLKLVSLGKIYAGTPRYFPLGKRPCPPVTMFCFPPVRIFQPSVDCSVNSDIMSLPCGVVSLWCGHTGALGVTHYNQPV